MRYITIPEDIDLVDNVTDEPLGQTARFLDVLLGGFCRDAKWGASTDALFSCMAVRDAVRGKQSGDVVEVESADWERLVAIVREPTAPYNPILAVQTRTFFDAVLKAPDKKA